MRRLWFCYVLSGRGILLKMFYEFLRYQSGKIKEKQDRKEFDFQIRLPA